jgi:hypothetical protein
MANKLVPAAVVVVLLHLEVLVPVKMADLEEQEQHLLFLEHR